VEWTFQASSSVGPDQPLLLVSFDPAETAYTNSFRRLFGIDAAVPLVGPYTGHLPDRGLLRLTRPLDLALAPDHQLLVDELAYGDQNPWPPGADGMGRSLTRRSTHAHGALPTSWSAEPPTPGRVAPVLLGDADHSGMIDEHDAVALVAALEDASAYERHFGAPPVASADADLDGDVDFDDIDQWLAILESVRESVISRDPFDGGGSR
jgi:hypothetical protein